MGNMALTWKIVKQIQVVPAGDNQEGITKKAILPASARVTAY
jgi:hypothetical protein